MWLPRRRLEACRSCEALDPGIRSYRSYCVCFRNGIVLESLTMPLSDLQRALFPIDSCRSVCASLAAADAITRALHSSAGAQLGSLCVF
jgi:hypothetical protein